jgi:alkylation response protein AidB-like acyl-CoA dehydrogenase
VVVDCPSNAAEAKAMDFKFTPADVHFRAEVRSWLRTNVPKEAPPHDTAPFGQNLRAYDLAWQKRLFEGGWAGVSWPVDYGGRGLSLIQQMIWHEEYASAGAPNVGCSFVGQNDAGPTLIYNGSDAQKHFHLPRILRGDAIWCQGYSEPEAGSDLASLTTSAEIDGDTLVVTGEKIWCSYAQYADFSELLVRTDLQSKRSKGLSWVIVDMRNTQGIDIEPLRDLCGNYHSSRVRYRSARIPLANVVGGLGNGWTVTNSSLRLKRGTGRIADQISLARMVESMIERARATPNPERESFWLQLAEVRAEVAALRAMSYAEISRIGRSGHPGAEGSMIRVFQAELNQKVHAIAMQMLGPEALAMGGSWVSNYLWSYTDTIGAGTKEMQRTIIAERLLGLPRDR